MYNTEVWRSGKMSGKWPSLHTARRLKGARGIISKSLLRTPHPQCHTLISLLFWHQNKPRASLRGLNPGKEAHAPVLSDSLLPLSVMLILAFGVGPRRRENEDPGQVWPVFALPTLLCWPEGKSFVLLLPSASLLSRALPTLGRY